ncbi:MAG TPA: hypothetical protein DEB39_05775 [Planctomycetaceae bacterium]|nr:hypothetical protein [Planctomycetaceae bacterium]
METLGRCQKIGVRSRDLPKKQGRKNRVEKRRRYTLNGHKSAVFQPFTVYPVTAFRMATGG